MSASRLAFAQTPVRTDHFSSAGKLRMIVWMIFCNVVSGIFLSGAHSDIFVHHFLANFDAIFYHKIYDQNKNKLAFRKG